MTREGYEKIRTELERMETVEMPDITERIALARAEGDLKENAEYHGNREKQGLLQAKINELKTKLALAEILDPSAMPQGEIRFGAKFKVKQLQTKQLQSFQLVGAGEDDFATGKILVTSPLAKGFLGKKVGENVKINVPAGLLEFEILEVSYE
jgi:transcription elongation factor GreA